MTEQDILSKVDHTNLKQTATFRDIITLCDQGKAHGVASVCIPPNMVKLAKEYMGQSLPICTVIGFPNGYATTTVKLLETQTALEDGASEIDMVIPINLLKEGKHQAILQEIQKIKGICQDRILKVIIETALLSEDEKRTMCQILNDSSADFIKTSTGFSTHGATLPDIELLRKHCHKHIQIKAAGGISSMEDGRAFLEAGANRLGTSRLICSDNDVY